MEAKDDPASGGDITRLLTEWKSGRADALRSLMPLVYQQLRRAARRCLRSERANHTLQPTALVHEAFLQLAGQDRANWQNRTQFLAVAARIMRRILSHYARARGAAKRGHGGTPVSMPEGFEPGWEWNAAEILAVDEALEALARLDPQQARVLELRWFGGLSVDETAAALGVSPRTVKRDQAMALYWMRRRLGAEKAA